MVQPTLHLIGKASNPITNSLSGLTSESYRALKINIDFLSGHSEIRSIAVTSSIRGEGKTRTALNLAIAYAQMGKKVLLIDADFRHPGVHMLFEGEMNSGLTNILVNQSEPSEALQKTNIEHLSVLTVGTSSPNSTELLTSQRMDALIGQLQQQFEMIVFDLPPVLNFIESKVLASKCSGVVLVVEQGKVKRAIARKVKEELQSVKANLLGVALNKTKKMGMEVYYY
ncbi:MAG: CpsD/CapB family tyrosine-protein kinase [Candidatus Cohnella colombiensis]|uniref:non-specific protein-tyrosine kinase n=1 Tax=Candidatus Cohnella colombiensis TaxID=3121368 RepID=A0AA95JGG2_9BACL|nr:MAG: CpsD/CapB family tyrosine-protein kinase [Cohnella sp.]